MTKLNSVLHIVGSCASKNKNGKRAKEPVEDWKEVMCIFVSFSSKEGAGHVLFICIILIQFINLTVSVLEYIFF